jgi:hypothetical protein
MASIADIRDRCMQALRDLHQQVPPHPMFGSPTKGLIRAPLTSLRKNGTSWTNYVASIFKDFEGVPLEHCWLSKSNQIKITKVGPDGKTELCSSILKVRLVFFLCNSTSENWLWLVNGDTESPFDHHCGRGLPSPPDTSFCVNGFAHGCPSTRFINESRKLCKTGCRALCNGHGTGLKCIFTHHDGSVKHCCMVEDHLPQCVHVPACFPFTH